MCNESTENVDIMRDSGWELWDCKVKHILSKSYHFEIIANPNIFEKNSLGRAKQGHKFEHVEKILGVYLFQKF